MSNDIKDKITSFTSAFKDTEYISLKEVDLSDKTRYEISDVSDLNERSSKLTYLETLNLSRNFLTKLILNNFLSLKRIDVSSNLLIETSLTLSKLTHLDLSHNMLSSFPDVSKLPKLEVLNLKHNVITKVSHLHLEPVSQTLTTLDISFNKIQFTTEEFITFIEMIRLFHLKHLNINGNDFFESKDKSNDKKDSYKKFMFATLEYVDTIDGEHNTINRNLLDKEEIKKQILLMKENVNEIERDKDDDDSERSRLTEKKEKSYSVNDKSQLNVTNSSINKQKRLNELNVLLEKLLQENGSNQVLYIKFLQRINELLITLIKDENENDVSIKEPFSQESFTEFIMNCNNLMIINPELTNTLFKLIFQFTLFSGNSKLSSQSSDSIIEKYIHSLINTDKKKDILDAIESIIVFPDLNINILHSFIRYLKDNKTKANTVLRNLILDLIYKLTIMNNKRRTKEENKNKDEIDLGITTTTTTKEEDKIYKELTIVKLIQLYFKTEAFVFKRIPESEREKERAMVERKQKTAKHLYNIAKEAIKESIFSLGQSQDKKNFLGSSIMQHIHVDNKDKEKVDKKKNEEQKEEQKEEQNNINQLLKNEDDTILKEQYGERFKRWINKNEPMYFGGKSLMQSYIGDFQNLINIGSVIIWNSKMNSDSNSFFKNQNMDNLYKELIQNKQFKKYKSDSKEYNALKFTFIFISALKECFSVLETINKIDINIVFKPSTTNKNNKQETQKHIDNFVRYYEYMKLFISLFKCYKYAPFFLKSQFIQVRTDTLLKELEIFIHKMYFEDAYISNHVSSAYASWRKQFLPKIMNVYGHVLYMLDERELLNTITQSKIILNIYEKLKQDRVEPFMLLGCCYVIHKLLLNEHFHQKELIAQTLFEQFTLFHNLLGYVDNQNTTKFKFIEERAEREKFIAFENNGNVIMHGNYKKLLIDITKTILSIFVTISMYGLDEYTISSSVNTMLMQLRKKGLHEVLQKNLISDIDCIRLNAIKCFFYFKHETISNDNILQIQEIIKNYSSIVKGKTELIISRIYITLNNKLSNASNKEYKPILQPMQIAVKNALEFLLKNSSRNPDDIKEVNEKNTLNLSLMLFLCTASCKPECFELVRNELGDQIHEIFNEIIYNDYYYIDENNYVPIEIERTLLGNYMIILLETLESKFCIPPYTYPFLRVLQKAADVICNFPDCTMEANYNGSINSLIDCLTNNEMVLRKRFRVNNEIKKWSKFQGVINEKEIIMKHSYLGWYEWTEMVEFKCNTMYANNNNNDNGDINNSSGDNNVNKSNDLVRLLDFYINNAREKYELVEEKQKKLTEYVLDPGNERKDKNKYYRMYFNKLSVPELVMEQYRFLVLFRNVLYHIIGESSKLPSGNNIANRLKAKFDLTLMNSAEILDMYEHYEKLSQVNTAFGSVKHFDLEIPNTTPFSQVVYNKIKRNQEQLNKLKLMNNDDDEHKNNNNDNSVANVNATENIQPQQYKLFLKDKIRIASSISSIYSLYKMNETKTFKAPDKFQNDLSRHSLNGIEETGKRIRKEETVDNPHLRSLTISAFLRCCFGLMISPSKEIRNDFIQQLFIDNKIKQILLLVDTSLHGYNNSNKICLLLEKIYSIDNLSLIIDTLKYRPAPSSQQKKNKTANEFINSFFYDSTLDNDSPSSSADIATASTYKNTEYKHHEEKIIFHSFYVISLYMEKLIYNYYMYFYRKKEENDFIFCYGLFAFLANYIDCVSQLHLDSINTIYYNHSIIKKFESKQLIDLILAMMKQYQHYLSLVFYFADLLQEKLSIRKGRGIYIEKQCRPIVESISKVLSYAANMQKHKYKFMKMVVTLGKHNTELMDKVVEYIRNETKGEIVNEDMKEIFRLQKLMSFTMHMKQLQPNEFILFSEFVECKVFNMKDMHYSKTNEGFSMDKIMNMLGVGGNNDDKRKYVSDNAFLILRQKYIVLYEQLVDKKTKAISIEHKKPLLTVPIEDIYQIMKFDYENKLIISIKNKTQGDKDNSFSICFCYAYLSSLFVDKVLSLKGNVIVKTHSGIQAAVANKEIDLKKAMYSKYSRTIQMRKRENELKKETDEFNFNDEIKLNNSSSSTSNNKDDDEKEMLLFTHSVNEIIKFKISTLNVIENNIYRNYTFSKANCSQFLVKWCICSVNAKDKVMNVGVVVLGDVNLYVIDEYKDFVHSLKMGMEGFDIKNKEEYYKIKEEVQLKCVKEVEECWDENEINITYCMIDDKDVFKKLCIKFSCYLEMRMFRCRLIEINKECYEMEELLNRSSKETTKGGVMSLNELPKFKCKMTINN